MFSSIQLGCVRLHCQIELEQQQQQQQHKWMERKWRTKKHTEATENNDKNGLYAHPEWKGKIYNLLSLAFSIWFSSARCFTSDNTTDNIDVRGRTIGREYDKLFKNWEKRHTHTKRAPFEMEICIFVIGYIDFVCVFFR